MSVVFYKYTCPLQMCTDATAVAHELRCSLGLSISVGIQYVSGIQLVTDL